MRIAFISGDEQVDAVCRFLSTVTSCDAIAEMEVVHIDSRAVSTEFLRRHAGRALSTRGHRQGHIPRWHRLVLHFDGVCAST
jgi:hypothetical protein